MQRGQTARSRGVPGLDLQAVLSYAYAVQSLRTRQKQALDRLATHTLEAVSGRSLAIGTVERSQLRWLVAAGSDNGVAGSELILPNELPDLNTPSDDSAEAVAVDGQYPVHVVEGAENGSPSAYVFISKAGNLLGVLAISRPAGNDFNDHDVRMLRIFAMSVDHVLGWSPTHPMPEGLQEVAARQKSDVAVEVVEEAAAESETALDLSELAGLFKTEAPTSSGVGLKLAVAVAVLILAVVGFYTLRHSMQKGASVVSPAPVAATKVAAEAPPDGVRVENPDPGLMVWEPTIVSTVPVSLEQVRIRRQHEQVFLIFELSGDTGVSVEHKSSPEQVIVHFSGAKVPPQLSVRGSDPMIAAFSARATARGAEMVLKLKRRVGVLLLGPTSDHHVIVNLVE